MDSLNEKRMQKERGKTPREVLEFFDDYECEIKSAIVIVQFEDDNIQGELSSDSNFEAIGIMETIKQDLINDTLDIYE